MAAQRRSWKLAIIFAPDGQIRWKEHPDAYMQPTTMPTFINISPYLYLLPRK